jgi:nicotinate-nucleotide adenylyltransferase
LEELATNLPGAELVLLIGADAAHELHTWKHVDHLRTQATLGVWRRQGVDVPDLGPGWRVETVDVPCLELSSTELRARAASGHPLDWLVPAPALRLIRERGLYADRE